MTDNATMLETHQFDRTLNDALGMGLEEWPTVSIQTLRWWCEQQFNQARLPFVTVEERRWNERGLRIGNYSLISMDAGDVVLAVAEAMCAARDKAMAELIEERR